LPPGFTDALAEIEKWSEDHSVAVGMETLRADLAEREGKDEEALAHWNTAAAQSLPIRRFHIQYPPLDAIEGLLFGPDPVRRGALLAARMGRSEEAWKLTRIAASELTTLDEAAEKADRSRLFAAGRLDALLVLVVDREKSLAAWSDAQGNRVVSIPAGLEKLRELVTELRLRGAGIHGDGAKPPTTPFDPSPSTLLSQVLLEPLGVPLRGRIGVCLSPELWDLPLGMLVVGEKFLVEQATIVRLTPGHGAWKVDDLTSDAVTDRLQELSGKDDAVRTVQLEMIEGHGSLSSARKHPWYWAGLELGRP
jgi:hypothetical protein